MNVATALLRANHMGIRDFKDHLSSVLKRAGPTVITDNGTPQNVVMPYEDVMELIDILDELQDPDTLKIIAKGRKAIKRGAKGRLVSKLFGKIMAKRAKK